jgi:hypothetical protein
VNGCAVVYFTWCTAPGCWDGNNTEGVLNKGFLCTKVPLRTVVVVGANVDVGSALWYSVVELMIQGEVGTEQGLCMVA